MRNIEPFSQRTPAGDQRPKISTPRLSALPDEDRRQIERYLEQPHVATRPFLGHVLRHKVSASQPEPDSVYDGVVTGSSRVTYSIDGGPARTGLLNHRARSDAGSGVIPVCSLLGAALIGMRVGQRAPFLREDGTIASLMVLDASPSA